MHDGKATEPFCCSGCVWYGDMPLYVVAIAEFAAFSSTGRLCLVVNATQSIVQLLKLTSGTGNTTCNCQCVKSCCKGMGKQAHYAQQAQQAHYAQQAQTWKLSHLDTPCSHSLTIVVCRLGVQPMLIDSVLFSESESTQSLCTAESRTRRCMLNRAEWRTVNQRPCCMVN